MNNNFPSKEIVERLRERYPAGTSVELVSMNDPHTSLRPGDRGVVAFVDDIGTLHINWDNGSSLGVVYGEDSVRKLEPDRHYETGADFWRAAVAKKGVEEAVGACGHYLKAQLKTDDQKERKFCRELFEAMYEDTAGRLDPSKVVYPYTFKQASEKLEESAYRESRDRNIECVKAIDATINASHYRTNFYNLDIAAQSLIQEYGFQRVNMVLANHIQHHDHDGRFSGSHKKWAAGIDVPEYAFDSVSLNSHAILIDGLARHASHLYAALDAQRFALPGCEEAGHLVQGYEILRSVRFNNERGFALGYNPAAPAPYVTWQLTEDNSKRDFYWGHYYADQKDAEENYTVRAALYMEDEQVAEKYNNLAAAEMSSEQNYNMVDGLHNNMPPAKADLTDGQTHEEIQELAPETSPQEKPSVLKQIREARKNPAPQAPSKQKDGHDKDDFCL